MSLRHEARETALKVLYFCEIAGTPADEALRAVFAEHAPDASDAVRSFTADLVHGTTAETAGLDEMIRQHAQNWRLERLALVDRLILRMAIWELQHEPDTAPAIVLNEAIELARTYSTDGSVAFVNGMLDAINRSLEEARGPDA